MSNSKQLHNQTGNAVLIVLAVLVVVGIGAMAYFSGKIGPKAGEAISAAEAMAKDTMAQTANAAENQQTATTTPGAETPPVIKPGNPVVAKLKSGEEIKRLDVFNYMQNLSPQVRQTPMEQLYPMALEQVINARLIAEKTKGVNLDGDEEVKKELAAAKEQIVRSVYLQKEVDKKINDQRLKDAYADYVKNFPDIQDVKARHILVKDESKAKELIKQLNDGADFAKLATDNSIDGTAKNGGDLGYFAKNEVVAPFGEAAFALNVGEYSKKPVKSDFGYHIIKVEEKRKRPPAAFDDVKPYLEAQVRRQILDEMVQGWRDEASIQRFDINGDAIEPSAGTPAPGAAMAPAPAPVH